MPTDPLSPTPALLAKLGSVIVRAEELLSPGGHEFDKLAMVAVIGDAEVQEWLRAMGAVAMLPAKRL